MEALIKFQSIVLQLVVFSALVGGIGGFVFGYYQGVKNAKKEQQENDYA